MAIVENLDQTFVDRNLYCPDGKSRVEFVDPLRTGLYIEVRATSPGQGTYYLRYKDSKGKTCHHKLARTAEMTLAEARKQARAAKASIVMGADPRGEEKAKKAVPTVATFFEESYLPHAKPRKRSWQKDEGLYRNHLAETFGDKRLNQIRRQEVLQFHADLLGKVGMTNNIGKTLTHASADHVVKLLRQMLNKAVEWEVIATNPIARIKLFNADNRKENYLSPVELKRLLTVLQEDENRTVCNVALFLLSTGARLNEALAATWADIDTETRVWRIAAANSKSKRVRSVPLNDSAIDVLTVLGAAEMGKKPKPLFVSGRTGMKLTHIHKVWDRLRVKAEMPGLRLHDLRHQYASFLVNSGRTLYEVQKILGHSSHSVTERYAHLSSRSLMEAANSASDMIRGAMQAA